MWLHSCDNSIEKTGFLSKEREAKFYSEENLQFLININNEILDKMKAADVNKLESAILTYPEIKEEVESRKKEKCISCEFNVSESFKLLKDKEFQNISMISNPTLKTKSEADTCRDGTSLTFCFIACAATPATVCAYPACCLACYYAFC